LIFKERYIVMYFKTVWGFSGTDEQKEMQKKQLRDVLTKLGADVTMDDVDLDGEKAFVITVES
jgi:alcohol dehydrogenase YqhD (iron-dependent ADH family)